MIARLLTDPLHGRARSLAAAMLAAALSGCGFGLLMPLVSLNLEAMTGSAVVVGWNTTAAALSTLVATPFIPILLSRSPARGAMVASLVFTAVGILLFPVWRDVWFWWLLRFLTGLAVTVVFVASETWINQLAKPEARARLLAVYATVLSGGFGSGGLVLSILGAEGWTPWIAGFAIFAIGAIPILLLKGPELDAPNPAESGPRAMLAAVRLAPAAILAGLLYGALETGLFTLVPVYAERLGLTVQFVGLLAMTGALGGIALQIPIGGLADRRGRPQTLLLVAGASVVLPLVILSAGAFTPALFGLIFLYGGIAGAFYTLGLAMMGERLTGGMLAVGNAAFIFAYGFGSLVGPPVSGAAMDAMDPGGLMLAFSATAALYLVIAVLVFARRRR
ncbi:MFS transporter [Marinicauda algicola]|uniref:MFS transporter n=1 Tax=Marinicauda algicola TaxID=2029849 RepID=A0A4S2H352_9PROT|nr:MFS transporter [Marinicauda algicola]TGY89781.1 MFS transporter [Marinicauda algicola]